MAANPAYTQYMMERSMMKGNNCHPDTPCVKTSEPVYLTSLASHGVWHSGMNKPSLWQQQQQQLELKHQQQLELQTRSCQNNIIRGILLGSQQPDLIDLMDSMQME